MLLVVAAVDNDATRKMCIEVLEAAEGDYLFVTPGNSDADDPDAAIKGNVLWCGRLDSTQIGINPPQFSSQILSALKMPFLVRAAV